MKILNFKNYYLTTIRSNLIKKFNYLNIHQVPKILKIQINIGLGINAQNNSFLQKTIEELRNITGQHPILTIAKKSISGFKLREGVPLGLKVTLRREKMYAFLEKFIKLVLPRVRDFKGLSIKHFDTFGNYNLGISDQLIFPEINYESIEQKHGFNITIVTTGNNLLESFYLLQEFGFPFITTNLKKNL